MFKKPLFIFELANNHSGNSEHARRIIRELKNICVYDELGYAVKLQYRDLDTFITDEAKASLDNAAVKRFISTRMSESDFLEIKNEIVKQGFMAICTPFDEISVDKIVRHGYDCIKVASCSFTDWPLLEKIVQEDKPMILSAGGAAANEIDRVVAFLTNRKKQFALLHCVGEYPTSTERLQLGQIDWLKRRYPNTLIGYSTHESPGSVLSIAVAIAKGAVVFEKHVGIETDAIPLNAYSANIEQTAEWLKTARDAFASLGETETRYTSSERETANLWNFKRGVFASRDIEGGEKIAPGQVRFAIPKMEGQMTANVLSKYMLITAKRLLKKGEPICAEDIEQTDIHTLCYSAHEDVKALLDKSGVVTGLQSTYEFSHHYGFEKFRECGATLIDVINNENYCKKLLVLLPGQSHPGHLHKIKDESFHVLFGSAEIVVDGVSKHCKVGEIVQVLPNQQHSFRSDVGCVMEEISTRHSQSDSFYDDPAIQSNLNRKTKIAYWNEMSENKGTRGDDFR